jgi:hypothetical protein
MSDDRIGRRQAIFDGVRRLQKRCRDEGMQRVLLAELQCRIESKTVSLWRGATKEQRAVSRFKAGRQVLG